MNLLYHIVKYDNFEEAKLFANILKPVTAKNHDKSSFKVSRINPGIINITGTNINGVYFKENYDSGWTAAINGKQTPILKAGLDFMYIPIPRPINNESQHIILTYSGSLVSWLLFYISILVFSMSIIYLLIPLPFHAIHHHTRHHVKHKVIKKIHTWWQKE